MLVRDKPTVGPALLLLFRVGQLKSIFALRRAKVAASVDPATMQLT
jgi:hypothetical protein